MPSVGGYGQTSTLAPRGFFEPRGAPLPLEGPVAPPPPMPSHTQPADVPRKEDVAMGAVGGSAKRSPGMEVIAPLPSCRKDSSKASAAESLLELSKMVAAQVDVRDLYGDVTGNDTPSITINLADIPDPERMFEELSDDGNEESESCEMDAIRSIIKKEAESED